ncbi:MAG: ExbD/TolR family protein [Symbiopectobacterium sp.]|uniref:ExbD/TolR family protein n=1 Tax=Symbiopectobacterium sp. TaxID=2952789 RepID=UPI0039ED5D2C
MSIDDEGQLFVAQTPTSLEQLEPRLIAAHSENERIQVQLRASETVNYGLVAKSLVSIERAGISKVAIVTAR